MGLVSLAVLAVPAVSAGETDVVLGGAGATFPLPLYRHWFAQFERETGIRVGYAATGSGDGIRQLRQRTVDFGATDAFMSDAELTETGGMVLHVPTCVGAVVITYNLPGNPELRLTPDIVAGIFSGGIRRWSDRRIDRVNPGISLPAHDITVVHRSESSGTTFLFTDYLTRVDDGWRKRTGRGKTVRWPTGVGVEGNPGVARMVGRIPGSIGYVELSYARQENLPAAALMNRSGAWVRPTVMSVTAAADVALPEDTRILLTDTPAPDGYPVSAFTYLIFYRDQAYRGRSAERARALRTLLQWVLMRGQSACSGLSYAPLPDAAVGAALRTVGSLTYGGTVPVGPPQGDME